MFESPWVLVLLCLLPVAVWLRRIGWGKPAALKYPEVHAIRDAFGGGRRPGGGWRNVLRLAALGILIIAAAKPRLELAQPEQASKGADIILALDISGSMAARDFEPLTRLEAAKDVLREFITSERNNRLGLVAFAAQAYTVCPLTLDYQALLGLLEHLSIGMTTDGTAIGMAIASSLNRLKNSAAKAKAIILLTDGRNNAGKLDPDTAAQMAAALQVRIYAIGMGKPGGAPIVVKDPVKGDTMVLNDDGSIHMEQVDEVMLQHLAAVTQGRFFRAADKLKLRAIYTEIAELERTRLRSKTYRNRQDAGHWLLGLAFVLILWELILAQTLARRLP